MENIFGSPSNEAEVEQRIIYPLLTAPGYLEIARDAIKPKAYLSPTRLDKEAGKRSGYFPDYTIWILGWPLVIVEAKDPAVPSEVGFREACLYARHLNTRYPTGVNPCKYVLASNGITLFAGFWDQEQPVLALQISDLLVGTKATDDFVNFCGKAVLEEQAKVFHEQSRTEHAVRPYVKAGGLPLLNAKLPLNSFAADLSPILRRYFSSANHDNLREIAERAYVSSMEITEYDRVLEALLKDRASPRRDTIVVPLQTSKNEEPRLTKAIQTFASDPQKSGQLQIIQGGVGSGKSLFARRYRELLEPPELEEINYWSFVDYNDGPASLKAAEKWLCETFISSFEIENPNLSIYESDVLRGVFSRKIQQRRAYYEQLRSINADEETVHGQWISPHGNRILLSLLRA